MNPKDLLVEVEPDAAKMEFSGYVCFHSKIETPAHTFDIFNVPLSSNLIQIKARDGFNLSILNSLIKRATEFDLSKLDNSTISVAEFNDPSSKFSLIGIAPPSIAECFKSQSKQLSDLTYWVFPLREGEFKGGETSSEFHFDNGFKGRGIHVIDWSRL